MTGVCSGFDIGVISGTLPVIKDELSLNLTQLSEIAGIVFFGALISKLISGPLMDFLSRKMFWHLEHSYLQYLWS